MDPLEPLPSLPLLVKLADIMPSIGIIIILILLSAFFSATETAITNCNRIRMKVKADEGKKNARLVLKLIEKNDKTLVTILIANNIVNILASAIGAAILMDIMPHNKGLATLLSTIIMTVLIFVFGEIIPKNIAKANSDRLSKVLCYPIYGLLIILTPISAIFSFLIFLFRKIFRINSKEEQMSEDDFSDLVEELGVNGNLDEEESDIIQAAVDFGDKTVHSVLTPVEKITALDIRSTSRNDLIAFSMQSDYSRIPFYDGNIDNIIGILNVRAFLKKALKRKNFSIRSMLGEVYILSPDMEISYVVEKLKVNKIHLAIVKDSHNKTVGLLTLEDVLEELVGDLEPKRNEVAANG